MSGCKTALVHDVSMTILSSFVRQFSPNVSKSTYKRGAEPNISWSKTCSYFSVKLIKQHIFKPKCNRRNKSMQEKESIMASLVMPNSYPRDGIFNPNLTTIKYSYIQNLFIFTTVDVKCSMVLLVRHHTLQIIIIIGSFTNGHFIWNLWNEPSASFINFIWNDHLWKILFIIWPF